MQRIYIDPGHGGRDTGAIGYGLVEKEIALDIGLKMSIYLRDNFVGMYRRMSRTDDTFVDLQTRTNDANSWGADVFVSIHVNAFDGSARGFETFIHDSNPTWARALQSIMHPLIFEGVQNFDALTPNRGQKMANFHVLRESQANTILTENLFIDHDSDAALLRDPNFISALAAEHAEGVANFLGLTRTS
ncbi:N-acetylmuramoyl-L-alanine amidase [Geomicrobium halophilum]|uniref:N-acetylmuramoyl-L-alanine amidase n=1 Tax=Geomicrobium halophilum TaxID=549000 RepID=A0A841Q0D2_9BACL|nr:N-acetylmuramoyl-L-alanine amidase [Geomicrobium halophilum]MBB6451083.1 N-acetylmuramoyl-L-alanine amidase [Geomicrobium halophilum]